MHLEARKGCQANAVAQVAAALCASYIGGSLNFAATATALGLPRGGVLAAAMAADNIVMAVRYSP